MSISGASMPAFTQPMTQTGLTTDDHAALRERGIPVEEAERQLALLRTPPPAIVLDRPCALGDGIMVLDDASRARLSREGQQVAVAGRVTKLVPASGAATRMFKELIAAMDAAERPSATPDVRTFFDQLDRFAFGAELRRQAGVAGDALADETVERRLLRTLLVTMRFAELPKGLIPFHRSPSGGSRTAFEEHLLEGVAYTRAADGRCPMHFTVPTGFEEAFEARLADVRLPVETVHRPARLEVGFSVQQPSTDTLAIDASGAPFRLATGALLFRPAGHGALLTNLQALGADLVVIKNIDNVLPDEASAEVVAWKQQLLGLLAELQGDVFARLREALGVDPGTLGTPEPDEARLRDTVDWIAARFGRRPSEALPDAAACRGFIVDALDRPLRVCGVVRNEGEPGGAPFWVRGTDGQVTIQIVESAQVNAGDADQQAIFAASTHFNPVDLACAVRRHDGTPFALSHFVDEGTVFLSRKSHDGRELTALERPGLWNGAMAGWNTVCVEVPGSTFAPVKTVLDLLRPQHQPGA